MRSVEFVYPSVLYLLLLLPLVVAFLAWRGNMRQKRLRSLGDAQLIELLSRRVSTGRRRWKAILWVGALAMLIVATARPTWGVRTDRVEAQGVSVYVLFDVSQSMQAEDVPPSRLQRAKIDVRELTTQLEGNEIGLIAFAGAAFVVFPLTTDVNTPTTFLNYLFTDTISQQGTSFGTAINLALQSFDESQATHKVIVLVTDGENQTDDLALALNTTVQQNIPVHVMAYGTEAGGSIPIRDSNGRVVGNKQDREGDVVITQLNEELLRRIASETGGLYQQAGDISNLARVINDMEGSALNENDRSAGVERFGLFIALALIFLSVEILTPEGTA